MATTVRVTARAGGATTDAARLADELAENVETIRSFRKVLDTPNTTGLNDIYDTSKILNKVDDDTFEMALDNDQLIKNLDQSGTDDLVAALNGIEDPTRLADIGKKLDPGTVNRIKQVNPALGRKLSPKWLGRGKNVGTKLARNRTSLENLQRSLDDISTARQGTQNPPRDFKAVKETSEAVNRSDGSVEQVSKTMAKRHDANSDDIRKSVKSVNKMLNDGSESSNSLKKALGELGITPGSVAIGAGVIVLLCMAYDTDNPFTAVARALDDTGKVVRGFKEVADEAAEAVKDTAKGGFNFISFVTNNSWISSACSILCVILLFALFMMGMLGSMGGNNKR